MRKAILILLGLAIVAFACNGGGSSMQLVGYTTDFGHRGSEGIFALYGACQARFGPDHRVCTVQEILDTANLPNPPPLPAEQTVAYAWVFDSGEQPSPCVRGSGSEGPVLTDDGIFTTRSCDSIEAIACCGPK